MNEFLARWRAESPAFFKRLKAIAISVGGSAAAVLVANKTLELNLPAELIDWVGYLIAACVAVAGTANLTNKNPPAQ